MIVLQPGRPVLVALVLAGILTLAACGQTGDLYLPDQARDVVTRPTQTQPPPASTDAPNSPRTPDSPAEPPSPAPEVTAPPEKIEPAKDKAEKNKAKPGEPPRS